MPLVYDYRKRRVIKKRGRRKRKRESKDNQTSLDQW